MAIQFEEIIPVPCTLSDRHAMVFPMGTFATGSGSVPDLALDHTFKYLASSTRSAGVPRPALGPANCWAAGPVVRVSRMKHTLRLASSHFTIDLDEGDDGIWTASMTFRGERLEARSETPEEAQSALLVALRSELSH